MTAKFRLAFKLTKSAVGRLESVEKHEIYWDAEVMGFGIRVAWHGNA